MCYHNSSMKTFIIQTIFLGLILMANIAIAQKVIYKEYFFGCITDPDENNSPIPRAKISLQGTSYYTVSDNLGYFALTIPYTDLTPHSKFIMEIQDSNFKNDTITLHGLIGNHILRFNMQQIRPYLSPDRDDMHTVPRSAFSSDSALYYIYGFVRESKTMYDLSGIQITLTDEKNSYIIDNRTTEYYKGYYSLMLPRIDFRGKKCTLTFSGLNFETVTIPVVFEKKYFININVLLNYLK